MSKLNPAESAPQAVRSTRLKALLRYWVEKSAGRAMPFRRQIEPIEIPGLLPIVLLADVMPPSVTPPGAIMRLLGSEATDAYGRETRGVRIEDIQLGDFSVLWQEAFLRVIKTGHPASAVGTYRRGLELCSTETVLTPISEDGSSVSQIFGGLVIRSVMNDGWLSRNEPRHFAGPAAGRLDGQRADGRARP